VRSNVLAAQFLPHTKGHSKTQPPYTISIGGKFCPKTKKAAG